MYKLDVDVSDTSYIDSKLSYVWWETEINCIEAYRYALFLSKLIKEGLELSNWDVISHLIRDFVIQVGSIVEVATKSIVRLCIDEWTPELQDKIRSCESCIKEDWREILPISGTHLKAVDPEYNSLSIRWKKRIIKTDTEIKRLDFVHCIKIISELWVLEPWDYFTDATIDDQLSEKLHEYLDQLRIHRNCIHLDNAIGEDTLSFDTFTPEVYEKTKSITHVLLIYYRAFLTSEWLL